MTRRAHLELKYNKINIYEDLKPHLKSWTFTDNMSGEADDLQIVLEDIAKLWIGDWMPDEGAALTATVIREDWLKEYTSDKLSLGLFEIDEIEVEYPPSNVTIKATSIPQSSSLRSQVKNRAWEKSRLSIVIRDVAAGSKLKYFYDTEDNPEYDRIDQSGETDLQFLMRICTDAGLCLKITDAQIVVFDERKYEVKPIIADITRGLTEIKSYSGRKTLNGSYHSCRVEYNNANDDITIKHTFTPPNPPKTGRVLVINERVTTVKEAELLAKKRLRDANKIACTFQLGLPGDTTYLAGLTVNLLNFGKFNGKYIITQATHGQQGGFETKLQLRKCLEGY
ncbi:hypothetical protein EHS13_13795 [Paenibacillus psychroresistens]|uniref:Phage late control D family protein n=1 Tax=Paenibacillus psychroresistens TaxID=1778678 RepID=A0A6B8RJV4_9BACL|nr:hypothetical protein [Paenibacillus psychroresistens]QGQ95872.1 hypothetical protein EHS13_13795 [Paenibacillus psychroresistens]